MNGVGIADLRARLKEYLRLVRRGLTLTVVDRDTPIEQPVPNQARMLDVRQATRLPRDVELPARPSAHTDSLAILLSDRGRR